MKNMLKNRIMFSLFSAFSNYFSQNFLNKKIFFPFSPKRDATGSRKTVGVELTLGGFSCWPTHVDVCFLGTRGMDVRGFARTSIPSAFSFIRGHYTFQADGKPCGFPPLRSLRSLKGTPFPRLSLAFSPKCS